MEQEVLEPGESLWFAGRWFYPGIDSPQLFRSGEKAQETGADGASGNHGSEGINKWWKKEQEDSELAIRNADSKSSC